MVCTKCGTKLKDTAVFCSKCGERVEKETDSNEENTKKQPIEKEEKVDNKKKEKKEKKLEKSKKETKNKPEDEYEDEDEEYEEKKGNSKLSTIINILITIVLLAEVVFVAVFFYNKFMKPDRKTEEAVKTFFDAINSADKDKIIESMDIKAACALQNLDYPPEDNLGNLRAEIDCVTEDEINEYKDNIKEFVKELKEDKYKIKSVKCKMIATSEINKDIKVAIVNVKIETELKEDILDSDKWEKSDIYKNKKIVIEAPWKLYLYKNKVITLGNVY